jgi:predicted DNA-binding protein (MmcQ/YjbR family)
MNIEDLRNYCMAKKGVTEHFPFDDKVLAFKVLNKIFVLANIENFDRFNAKCNPERALELREMYQAVEPGYHMSKIHWNSVFVNRDLPPKLAFELIDHSYDLIVESLPKKLRQTLTTNK